MISILGSLAPCAFSPSLSLSSYLSHRLLERVGLGAALLGDLLARGERHSVKKLFWDFEKGGRRRERYVSVQSRASREKEWGHRIALGCLWGDALALLGSDQGRTSRGFMARENEGRSRRRRGTSKRISSVGGGGRGDRIERRQRPKQARLCLLCAVNSTAALPRRKERAPIEDEAQGGAAQKSKASRFREDERLLLPLLAQPALFPIKAKEKAAAALPPFRSSFAGLTLVPRRRQRTSARHWAGK